MLSSASPATHSSPSGSWGSPPPRLQLVRPSDARPGQHSRKSMSSVAGASSPSKGASSSQGSSSTRSRASLDVLPEELLAMVLGYLSMFDLRECCLVNRHIAKVARRLMMRELGFLFQKIKQLIKGLEKVDRLAQDRVHLRHLHLIQKLDVDGHPDEIELYFELKAVCKRILPHTNIQSLTFLNSATSSVLDIVVSSLPSLRSLYANSFPRITFIHNPAQLLNLRELVLKVKYLPPSFHEPFVESRNLTHLSIATAWMSPIHLYHFLHLPASLQRLSISTSLSQGHHNAAVPDFSKAPTLVLRVLHLRLTYHSSGAKSMAALQAFLDHIITQTLLFMCPTYTAHMPRLPAAAVVRLGNVPTVHLDCFSSSRSLAISHCPVARPFTNAQNLTQLTFHRCAMRNLHKLAVFTPNLASLTLVRSETSDFALASTLLSCSQLNKLSLIQCTGLTADLGYTVSSRPLLLYLDVGLWNMIRRQVPLRGPSARACRVTLWRGTSDQFLGWLKEPDFSDRTCDREVIRNIAGNFQPTHSIDSSIFDLDAEPIASDAESASSADDELGQGLFPASLGMGGAPSFGMAAADPFAASAIALNFDFGAADVDEEPDLDYESDDYLTTGTEQSYEEVEEADGEGNDDNNDGEEDDDQQEEAEDEEEIQEDELTMLISSSSAFSSGSASSSSSTHLVAEHEHSDDFGSSDTESLSDGDAASSHSPALLEEFSIFASEMSYVQQHSSTLDSQASLSHESLASSQGYQEHHAYLGDHDDDDDDDDDAEEEEDQHEEEADVDYANNAIVSTQYVGHVITQVDIGDAYIVPAATRGQASGQQSGGWSK
ncbi:hypothetical protein RI367_005132 [Sorochytrium milnesiophthora]